jgi:molecular chaperone DnaJ
VADGDYFQILGVPRDAGTDEIRRAHQVLSAGLAPGSLHPAVAADLETEIRDIRLVLDEATRLLSDEDLRGAYREHLPAPPPFPGDVGDAARAS